MLGWRLCRRPYADLTGEGARLHGGRWNPPGHGVVYLAADPALCVLEVRVHLDLPLKLLPEDYVLMAVDLSNLAVERVPDLPTEPRAVGQDWLAAGRTPLLAVPSVIVPESANLLLNPAHPASSAARLHSLRPFAFDARLWPN